MSDDKNKYPMPSVDEMTKESIAREVTLGSVMLGYLMKLLEEKDVITKDEIKKLADEAIIRYREIMKSLYE